MKARTLVIVMVTLVSLLAGMLPAAPAYAVEDANSPVLTGVDFNPKVIDTSTAAQSVVVSVNFTDDLAGVNF